MDDLAEKPHEQRLPDDVAEGEAISIHWAVATSYVSVYANGKRQRAKVQFLQ